MALLVAPKLNVPDRNDAMRRQHLGNRADRLERASAREDVLRRNWRCRADHRAPDERHRRRRTEDAIVSGHAPSYVGAESPVSLLLAHLTKVSPPLLMDVTQLALARMRCFTLRYLQTKGWQAVLCARMYCSSLRRRSETEVKMPRARRSRSILANQSSTRFGHEA